MLPSRIETYDSLPRHHQELSLSFELMSYFDNEDDFENERRIYDLCTFIKNFGDPLNPVPTPSLHILVVRGEKYVVRANLLSTSSAVCLDDYLSPYQEWEISRKERIDLALSLSLAVLVFYSTPWIDNWWTWRDFYTLKDDKSQIFIRAAFYGVNRKSLPRSTSHPASILTFWDCYGEPILTRLGLALIELALGKRLSEFQEPSGDPNVDQDMKDVYTAQKLVTSGRVLQEAGQIYHDVVEACLSHQVTELSAVIGLVSKHPNFQQDLERFVAAPIRNYHAATWGQVSEGKVHSNLDLALETTQSSTELDSNLNSPLEINKRNIEPDWITYEWEIPEVMRLRCLQGDQQMSLAETLRTTIVLIGYDFHFEAATCEGYLKREWGNLGIELLELIISSICDSPKSPCEYPQATYTT